MTESTSEIQEIREYFTKLRTKIKTYEKQYELKNNGAKPDTNKIKSNFKLYSNYQKYWHLKKLLSAFDSKEETITIDHLIHDWSKFCKKLKLKAQQYDEKYHNENKLSVESKIKKKHVSKSKDKTKLVEKTPPKNKLRQIPTSSSSAVSSSSSSSTMFTARDDSETSSQEEEDDDENMVIGPTPQLNGRVLSVFDIKLSPEKTPVSTPKHKSKSNNLLSDSQIQNGESVEFKTPSKKPVQRKLIFTSDHNDEETVFRTPSKNMKTRLNRIEIEATPAYLRTESFAYSQQISNFEIDDNEKNNDNDNDIDNDNDNLISGVDVGSDCDDDLEHSFGDVKKVVSNENQNLDIVSPSKYIEPSPILRKSTGKSLFKMNEELHELKRTLKFDELDEINESGEDETKELVQQEGKDEPETLEEMIKEADEDDHKFDSSEEQVIEKEQDRMSKYRKKVKTIKRSTRRVKLKTTELDDEDEFKDVDIHEQMKEMEKESVKRQADDDGSTEEEYDDYSDENYGEEDYERKDFKDLKEKSKKNSGKHPLSNNFVRMKIHHKNRGKKFQRRR